MAPVVTFVVMIWVSFVVVKMPLKSRPKPPSVTLRVTSALICGALHLIVTFETACTPSMFASSLREVVLRPQSEHLPHVYLFAQVSCTAESLGKNLVIFNSGTPVYPCPLFLITGDPTTFPSLIVTSASNPLPP